MMYELSERESMARTMRQSNATFKQIGEALHVTAQRAKAIVDKAETKLRRKSLPEDSLYKSGLPVRAVNNLAQVGIDTRAQLLEADREALKNIPHLGERNYSKIIEYLSDK